MPPKFEIGHGMHQWFSTNNPWQVTSCSSIHAKVFHHGDTAQRQTHGVPTKLRQDLRADHWTRRPADCFEKMCRNEGYWLFQWIQNPPNYALVTAHGLGWYMSNRNIQREYCIAISSCMVHGYGSKPTGALVFTPKLLLVMPCYIYVTYPSSWSISPWSCILKVPSGKLTKNYIWKITIMGKLHYFYGHFQ